jgi:hypothetical protein
LILTESNQQNIPEFTQSTFFTIIIATLIIIALINKVNVKQRP